MTRGNNKLGTVADVIALQKELNAIIIERTLGDNTNLQDLYEDYPRVIFHTALAHAAVVLYTITGQALVTTHDWFWKRGECPEAIEFYCMSHTKDRDSFNEHIAMIEESDREHGGDHYYRGDEAYRQVWSLIEAKIYEPPPDNGTTTNSEEQSE
jgi:hypothetical protein